MSSEEDFSDEGDCLMPLGDHILDCLNGIHSAGSFATSEHNVEHIHPGLTVKDVGLIRLPLSSEDAEALIRMSRRAPFGKGSETLVDETVRKTWEIDGKELSFENKSWNSWLGRVLDHVSEGLGIPGGAGSVRAELYKLLVYEQGAFFKPHKDTEKTNNMFGTLVICLPSEHVGGGVRLIHGKDERILESDKWSRYGVSYLAWYSDVSHEVLPIQSGYRFVLTYNLINNAHERHLSATVLDIEQSKIDRMLTQWHATEGRKSFMCYVLQHKYTGVHLQMSNLKGDDYYRCSQLDRACHSNGAFHVFLSPLELTVTRINDEGYEEEGNEELCLSSITSLQGVELQDSLTISKDSLVQRNLYQSREHDEQWGGEHLGNQHADIQQVYHDAVAIVVSRDCVTEFLLGSNHNLTHYYQFLQRLFAAMRDQNGDERRLFREMIVQTCQKHIERQYTRNGDKDRFMGPTALASLRIENPEAAKAALYAVKDSFDTSTFQDLGRLGFKKTKEFSAEAFSRISKLHLVERGLRAFRSGLSRALQLDASEDSEGVVHQWAEDVLCKSLNSITEVLPKDAGAVIQIINTYEDERLWKNMDAFVGRSLDDATFASTLLVEILCYSKMIQKPDLVVDRFLPPVLDRAISSFRLQHFSSLSKHQSSEEDYPFSSWPGTSADDERGRRDASVVALLYRQFADYDLNQAGQLLEKIVCDTTSIDQHDLDRFIIPLLCEIVDVVKHQPSQASLFYSEMITTYTTRMVQKEPPKPRNWSLLDDAEKCYRPSCTYCSPVRDFLEDPSQEDRDFVIPEDQYYSFTYHIPSHYKKTRERTGEYSKIKVTKSLETWEGRHREWRSRVDHAQLALRSLPETPLRQCLGDGVYQSLMELRVVKLPVEDTIMEPPDSDPEGERKRKRVRI